MQHYVNKWRSLKKNMIFNTNREQNLPLWIVYCYLASGTYETWNPLGNACIQAMYVVWSQLEQSKFFVQPTSNHPSFKFQTCIMVLIFYSFPNILNNVKVWTLGCFHSFCVAEAMYIVFLKDQGSVFKVL